jgi:uncharacterized protein Yka (UPF0111/DUF47 family)
MWALWGVYPIYGSGSWHVQCCDAGFYLRTEWSAGFIYNPGCNDWVAGGFLGKTPEKPCCQSGVLLYKSHDMFSIQKWFAKDDQFFRLLQASAEEGRSSVQALKKILQNAKPDADLTQFAAARRKDKEITVQISELLARVSISGLDREDIEAISRALYRVPKTVDKFATRYVACAAQLGPIDFSRQVALVEQAVDTVAFMIKELEFSRFESVNQANERLQTIEGDADKLVLQLLTELYHGQHPPLRVTMAKDLYELLEKVVDRCRDAGNVIDNVVLKHS